MLSTKLLAETVSVAVTHLDNRSADTVPFEAPNHVKKVNPRVVKTNICFPSRFGKVCGVFFSDRESCTRFKDSLE